MGIRSRWLKGSQVAQQFVLRFPAASMTRAARWDYGPPKHLGAAPWRGGKTQGARWPAAGRPGPAVAPRPRPYHGCSVPGCRGYSYVGAGSSCCPKCGSTYEGIGGGPKAAVAPGKPAAVLPAALESPEAALVALKEMVGNGQCKVAEAPKAKDAFGTAVRDLASAANASRKAANQLSHLMLLRRQAEEKLANLGRKVVDCLAECSVLDEAYRKAQAVHADMDAKLKAGAAAVPVEPCADVAMGDSDRLAKVEALCREIMADRDRLRDELKQALAAPGHVPPQARAAPAAAPVRRWGTALDRSGLWAAASAEPAAAAVQTPAAPVFESGWSASAPGPTPSAAAPVTALVPAATGTAQKRGSDGGSDGSGRSRASRRARGHLGGSQERASGSAGPDKEVTAEEAIKIGDGASEVIRRAAAEGAAADARRPASG